MFISAINSETRQVLEKIKASGLAKDFYLAGGTALAVQLGHRESIDLDWFSGKVFSNAQIKDALSGLGKFEVVGEEENTLHGTLDDVRVSFLFYSYKNIFPLRKFLEIDLADERDISAMKISAMSSRGSKKDFIDLYFLLEKYSIEQLLDFFSKKFEKINYNPLHILKSFLYFETADAEPMPKMLEAVDWEEVKKNTTEKVSAFLKR